MDLDRARKLLAVKDDTELIAINRKAAEDLSEYVTMLHTMLVGVEECTQTVNEFRQMLIRLSPDAKLIMQHTVGINRVMATVVEHVFLTGSGDPDDVAKLRYQANTLKHTGKLSISD